jgi:ectoine hydroxylase-related dioxygenase (phytanoyl-CoA dioxygenase family)
MYKLIKACDVGLSKDLKPSIESIKQRLDTFSCIDDQPGAIRYHLDDEEFVWLLLPWIEALPMRSFISDFFATNNFFITYVRCRSPLKNQGQQKYHRDWFTPKERLEVFIAVDGVNQENGPLEVSTSNKTSRIIVMDPGDICILDSETLHRGTRNISGKTRRLISLHIASQLKDDEDYVSYFNDGRLSRLQ